MEKCVDFEYKNEYFDGLVYKDKKFINCNFYDCTFNKCTFINCSFEDCDFEGTEFVGGTYKNVVGDGFHIKTLIIHGTWVCILPHGIQIGDIFYPEGKIPDTEISSIISMFSGGWIRGVHNLNIQVLNGVVLIARL